MLIYNNILSEMMGLVGWKQPTNSAITVTNENKASSSGLFVQSANKIVTLKNIKATVEDPNISDVNLNAYLQELQKDAIGKVLNEVFENEDIFQTDYLYREANLFSPSGNLEQGKVGYSFNLPLRQDRVVLISEIVAEFTEDATIDILVISSEKNTPVKTIPVEAKANESVYVPCEIYLQKGIFFIGYQKTNEKPTKVDYLERTKFNSLFVRPVIDNIPTAETWGLNFNITTGKEYSRLVLQNKLRFAKAIQLQTAVEVINLISSTKRQNAEERMIKVNGVKTVIDSPDVANVFFQLESEIKRLKSLYLGAMITSGTLR